MEIRIPVTTKTAKQEFIINKFSYSDHDHATDPFEDVIEYIDIRQKVADLCKTDWENAYISAPKISHDSTMAEDSCVMHIITYEIHPAKEIPREKIEKFLINRFNDKLREEGFYK
jgi:hypothetical protein